MPRRFFLFCSVVGGILGFVLPAPAALPHSWLSLRERLEAFAFFVEPNSPAATAVTPSTFCVLSSVTRDAMQTEMLVGIQDVLRALSILSLHDMEVLTDHLNWGIRSRENRMDELQPRLSLRLMIQMIESVQVRWLQAPAHERPSWYRILFGLLEVIKDAYCIDARFGRVPHEKISIRWVLAQIHWANSNNPGGQEFINPGALTRIASWVATEVDVEALGAVTLERDWPQKSRVSLVQMMFDLATTRNFASAQRWWVERVHSTEARSQAIVQEYAEIVDYNRRGRPGGAALPTFLETVNQWQRRLVR